MFVLFSLLFLLCFFFFVVSSVDRESEIGDRKLESWTLRILEDCSFFCFFLIYVLYDSFGYSPKCYAILQVLVCFFYDILIFEHF